MRNVGAGIHSIIYFAIPTFFHVEYKLLCKRIFLFFFFLMERGGTGTRSSSIWENDDRRMERREEEQSGIELLAVCRC